MRIIKVSATESTNNMAKEWYASNKDGGAVVIVTNEQSAGRGQRGASWISNAGENVTMSILYPHPALKLEHQFMLSAGVGLAVVSALNNLKINKIKLKWPNDIMAANNKIGGILIENILSNGKIAASVIGLGLNVNQTDFPGLPKASSLKLFANKEYELEKVLKEIVLSIKDFLDHLGNKDLSQVIEEYESILFRRDKISTFELPGGEFLTGIILGITSTGLLKVQVEESLIHTYDLKEIKLLF